MEQKANVVEAGGFVEKVQDGELVGWSANPANSDFSDRIELTIGGFTTIISTSIERKDVESAGYEDNVCGFRFNLESLSIEDLLAMRGRGDSPVSITARSLESGIDLGILCPGVSVVLIERLVHHQNTIQRLDPVGEIDGLQQGSITGWCIFKKASETPRVIMKVDGVVACTAPCDIIRTDVETVFGKLHSGFALPLPFSVFDSRQHLIEISEIVSGYCFKAFSVVCAPLEQLNRFAEPVDDLQRFLLEGNRLLERIKNQPSQSIPLASGWHELFMRDYRTPEAILDNQRSEAKGLDFRPKFSIVCPTWNTDVSHLAEAINSVTQQTYDNWELIISDDNSSNNDVSLVLQTWKDLFPEKITVLFANENVGISDNTNRALERATGDFIVFFDHDDVMEPDALYAFASVQQKKRYKLIYTDEDTLGSDDRLRWPHLKPAWDPILLAGINYVCHLVCVDRSFAGDDLHLDHYFDGAQDKEFLLRLASRLQDDDVLHIPRVLYHWRHHAASTSKDLDKAERISQRSVNASANWAQTYFADGASVTAAEPREMFGSIVQPNIADCPLVSIIIPTQDKCELLLPCISSILSCKYPNLEIIVIDHESRESLSRHALDVISNISQCVVLPYKGSFNWSAMNNFASRTAKGDILLFLNNDTEFLSNDVLNKLVGFARNPLIGAVGAKLIYANGQIQHGGVVIGPGGIAGHSFVGLPRDDLGYFGYLRFARTVSAVTGACLMVRKQAFWDVKGFEQDKMRVGLSDIDLCLKLQANGLRNVFVGSCEIMHLESVSRGSDEYGPNAERFRTESRALRLAHSGAIDADQCYNPAFEARSTPYQFLRVGPGPAYDFRQKAS